MRAAAAVLFAALALAPVGLAAPLASETGMDGRPQQTSYDASSVWQRIAQWPLSKDWRAPAAAGSTMQSQTGLVAALVQEINDVRRERGLRAFVTSAKLSAAAAQHTREMGVEGYFEHESYDSTPFWKRIERWYPSKRWRSWSVGENLLYSSPDVTASEGVELWMGSPPHRANLLNRSWREIGISAMHFDAAPGEYEGEPVTIVTADFGVRR